jgi:rhamnose utilization protein RhaD (predicted bifunctional aldolase and dehydrogenase)/NAD(P)-dependent dehydrogenase (short-subunit alcohol dehydrogenase family)
MIENKYDENEAAKWVAEAGDERSDQELAQRVYTSRLIGQNPDLVMHGGGNTSVKLTRENLFGEIRNVIHVKGSGWDLDTIRAPGLPGLWLDPLRELRKLNTLSDAQMVNVQRANLLYSSSPNPSVETLLHAFLPHKFVDHTHATTFLILANLPHATDICREIFGPKLGIVPYIMPGFALAKKAAEVFDSDPNVEGLMLLGHGHFAFGETAKESYDLIISHTQAVADYLKMEKPTALFVRQDHAVHDVLPVIRGLVAEMIGPDAPMPIMDMRNGAEQVRFMERTDVDDLAKRGTASPDHVIRIKGRPLVLRKSVWSSGRAAIRKALDAYASEYRAMFERQAPLADQPKKMLPPDPKTIWMEGVGFIGLGVNAKAARIAGDLVVQNARVRAIGEDAGGFYPISEKDLFDCEYWSLEQAKLGKGTPPKMQGKVVMVTGGAGTIGFAIAKAFAKLGAQCFLVDLDQTALEKALESLGEGHAGLTLNVTEAAAARRVMHSVVAAFGGLDILVSNAGAALAGPMLDLSADKMREAFELNFFSHHAFATEAAKLIKAQARGGQILFNISKQAVNPGKNFGAYGMPKAATFFLMRQLALELGGDGVRVNGVNADRIRSGLLTDDFIAERASARGVSEDQYMAGNLLNKEVRAEHVAEAFIALALSERTTGHVMTVDGGNIEAALR